MSSAATDFPCRDGEGDVCGECEVCVESYEQPAAQGQDNPRFWKAVQAWCVGQLTDREFIDAQLQTIGFVWLKP